MTAAGSPSAIAKRIQKPRSVPDKGQVVQEAVQCKEVCRKSWGFSLQRDRCNPLEFFGGK